MPNGGGEVGDIHAVQKLVFPPFALGPQVAHDGDGDMPGLGVRRLEFEPLKDPLGVNGWGGGPQGVPQLEAAGDRLLECDSVPAGTLGQRLRLGRLGSLQAEQFGPGGEADQQSRQGRGLPEGSDPLHRFDRDAFSLDNGQADIGVDLEQGRSLGGWGERLPDQVNPLIQPDQFEFCLLAQGLGGEGGAFARLGLQSGSGDAKPK